MLSFAVTRQDEGGRGDGRRSGARGGFGVEENMKMHFTSLYLSSSLDIMKEGMDLLLYVLYLIGFGNI